jgi:hypothetical protein
MNHALAEAVQTVAEERGRPFDKAFEAASRLVTEYGEAGLAERVITDTPASVPWEVVADLLGILEWSTQDNGAAIHKEVEAWLLEGMDLRKVQVALHLDVYPFDSLARMSLVLGQVSATHPQVASRCAQLIEQRRAIGVADA